jgi:hypothetical protein
VTQRKKPEFLDVKTVAQMMDLSVDEVRTMAEDLQGKARSGFITIEEAAEMLECSTVYARIILHNSPHVEIRKRTFYVHIERKKDVYKRADVVQIAEAIREQRRGLEEG